MVSIAATNNKSSFAYLELTLKLAISYVTVNFRISRKAGPVLLGKA